MGLRGDDDEPKWRLKRDRMDGGELLVTRRDGRRRAEVIVGNLDELVREVLGNYPARREALEAAVEGWRTIPTASRRVVLRHGRGRRRRRRSSRRSGPAAGRRSSCRGRRRRRRSSRRRQDALLEDLPDEGDDGPSREFRAAQQDGYLRQGDSDDPDEREGLGQFGARRSDTQALEDFESDA
ncbi:hypothetical protein QIT48_gp18 [Haloterrigena jeotgali icosahedral virus 1]|uniref:Uncharacterized protein n=1 Tax=Haloterrigena jeotgali icosahedral virus 1 TaxID=2766528 RepID=A0A7G2JX96_9VIRU|nr:hypothetical protein QIT48_gp18 [Haloterrigena jeotgali icosahedral virus 1]QCC57391.1 hypothetical protein DVR14_01540 [Natrinema thermotolerans]DAC85296.1 TPA_asm: hypothetical protein HJIV1gp18 [Haloterrigena jeotgali icosahedral virus 1]